MQIEHDMYAGVPMLRVQDIVHLSFELRKAQHLLFCKLWFIKSYLRFPNICPGEYWKTGFHCPGGNHHMKHKRWRHPATPKRREAGSGSLSGLLYETPSSDPTSVPLNTHTHTPEKLPLLRSLTRAILTDRVSSLMMTFVLWWHLKMMKHDYAWTSSLVFTLF